MLQTISKDKKQQVYRLLMMPIVSDKNAGGFQIRDGKIYSGHRKSLLDAQGYLVDKEFAGDTMCSFNTVANRTPGAGSSASQRTSKENWPPILREFYNSYHCLANFWLLPMELGRTSKGELNKVATAQDFMDRYLEQIQTKVSFGSVDRIYFQRFRDWDDFLHRHHLHTSYVNRSEIKRFSSLPYDQIIRHMMDSIRLRALSIAESDRSIELWEYFNRIGLIEALSGVKSLSSARESKRGDNKGGAGRSLFGANLFDLPPLVFSVGVALVAWIRYLLSGGYQQQFSLLMEKGYSDALFTSGTSGDFYHPLVMVLVIMLLGIGVIRVARIIWSDSSKPERIAVFVDLVLLSVCLIIPLFLIGVDSYSKIGGLSVPSRAREILAYVGGIADSQTLLFLYLIAFGVGIGVLALFAFPQKAARSGLKWTLLAGLAHFFILPLLVVLLINLVPLFALAFICLLIYFVVTLLSKGASAKKKEMVDPETGKRKVFEVSTDERGETIYREIPRR